MSQRPLIVLGPPRSGTSLVTWLCIRAGYDPEIFLDSKFFGGSPYNPDGYHEEVRFTLLNDQLIRGVYGENFSFLFPPEFNGNKVASDLRDDFYYDLNEATLSIKAINKGIVSIESTNEAVILRMDAINEVDGDYKWDYREDGG